MSQVKKILIIGSSAYKKSDSEVRIDCYSWREVGEIRNPRDYHTLVINLLSLSNEKQRNQVRWNDVDSKLNVSTWRQIMKRNGEIIFVGDPRFCIPLNPDTKKKDSIQEKPFLQWTGLEFNWDNDPSDTIFLKERSPVFDDFLKGLCDCDYSLFKATIDRGVLEGIVDLDKIDIDTLPIATNISGNSLVFVLRPKVTISRDKSRRLGYMIFLPRIDASEEETLEIVLRDFCNVTISLPEPQWIQEYITPGQEVVDKEISDYSGRIKKAKVGLEKSEKERTKVRRPLKLLYGTGTDLEEIVWDVLEALEAKVERPHNSSDEDGWISVRIGNYFDRGVLEIKSTRNNQFNKKGIRQLGEWIAKKTAEDGKQYKGIFIGNDSSDKPIEEREHPFSPDFEKSAKILKFCCLRTEDLYKIYLAKSSGKFDAAAFWSDVFGTNGILDVGKYYSDAIPKGDYSS